MANNLSVRKSANSLSEKLADLSRGDTVEYISSTNGWNKVRYKGQIGYVSSYYLKDTGEEVENVGQDNNAGQDSSVGNEDLTINTSNGQAKASVGNTNYVDMGMTLDEHVDLQMSKAVNTLTVGGWRRLLEMS